MSLLYLSLLGTIAVNIAEPIEEAIERHRRRVKLARRRARQHTFN